MRKLILLFVVAVLFTACATQSRGYDYKTHHRKSANAKPSKCYKQHNKW